MKLAKSLSNLLLIFKIRVKVLIVLSILLSQLSLQNVSADNANPPKILDLVQITQGPYQPGDLIKFKIVYTGGNPGLKGVGINYGKCTFHWDENWGLKENNGNGIDGVFIAAVPMCEPGTYTNPVVGIQDKTLLSNTIHFENNPLLSFVVGDYSYKPLKPGEIAPLANQSHTLDLSFIPKNPKVGDSYLLPSRSSIGMPIIYGTHKDQTCEVVRPYQDITRLPGATLKIKGFGWCFIDFMGDNGEYWWGVERPSAPQPTTLANGVIDTKSRKNYTMIHYEIKPLKSTIQCAKGKTIKVITGINPVCPKGYALKK